MTDTTVIDPAAPIVDPAPEPVVAETKPADPVTSPFKPFTPHAPVTAKDRLRAFEDKNFGKDVPRIGGAIERGHGSPFKAMPAEKQAEYAAIEKIVEAEQKVADASAELETSKANLVAATKLADARAAAVKEPAA
jgi:hypothetical protein